MQDTSAFLKAYEKLNTAQKKAVDALDGPVMVVAGPGTGKTQILTLRIANILHKTDTPPHAILCLTFTRSGVAAMRDRLESYIGTISRNVKIATFHSFGIEIVEKYFHLLDFTRVPKLLDDEQSIAIVDELLETGNWEFLRPRTDPTRYFHDLKSLISILKRERMTPEQFSRDIDQEISQMMDDPENLSSRGPTKGQLKKEIEKSITSLKRTKEVVAFYGAYEDLKKQNEVMDYDDVLEYVVYLVEEFEDVRADIRENYHYVLIDEHQDSSGVQNAFLKAVWKDVERPDIFVVGDDRQLIYGFSGANLDYFTDFKTAFGSATMITLTENYRSTAPILSLADELLKSSVTNESLRSNREGTDLVSLRAYRYGRDELIGVSVYFKQKISEGVSPSECVLLVPKNRQVREAHELLRSLGVPVVSDQGVSLLVSPEAKSLLRILGLIVNPFDSVLLSEAMLDQTSGIPPLEAHTFLKNMKKPDQLTLAQLVDAGNAQGLFAAEHAIGAFGTRLSMWINALSHDSVSYIVGVIGNELLIDKATDHGALLRSIEVVRTILQSALVWERSHHKGTLKEFLAHINRLGQYGGQIDVARLGEREGVRIMTLHKSKGLEFEHVWIAHMNEEVFMSEKRGGFTLPKTVEALMAERDLLTAKRELYVAITRAKAHCVMSFAELREDQSPLTLARIIEDLSDAHFITTNSTETEASILELDPRLYAMKPSKEIQGSLIDDIKNLVRDRFTDLTVSVSMLNNFYECPWKWYFRNFLKLPEPKTVSLALGSAVHETIEMILKAKELPDESAMGEGIRRALHEEGIYDEAELARLSKDAYQAVTMWIESYYRNLAKDRESERAIGYRDKRFPNVKLFGKIDLTERLPGGSIIVTDFKTGSSKTSGLIEKRDEEGRLSTYLRQLAMYSYLIQGNERNRVDESRLLFLEESPSQKNALYSTHITDEHIELLVKDILDYQDMMLDGTWTKRTCYAKPYGTQTECDYCRRMRELLAR